MQSAGVSQSQCAGCCTGNPTVLTLIGKGKKVRRLPLMKTNISQDVGSAYPIM